MTICHLYSLLIFHVYFHMISKNIRRIRNTFGFQGQWRQNPYLHVLAEEYRLSIFENRIMRRIFGSKRDENGKELSWFGSGYGLLESPCECGIELPGFISHEVRKSDGGKRWIYFPRWLWPAFSFLNIWESSSIVHNSSKSNVVLNVGPYIGTWRD